MFHSPSVGQMIEIVRNGQSLVLEDGSLQLTDAEDDIISSGSGLGISPPPPTQSSNGDEGRKRRGAAFLSPVESALPILPETVDEIVISWSAIAEVSPLA